MSLVKAVEFLKRYEVLLASGSPRRLEIFTQIMVRSEEYSKDLVLLFSMYALQLLY